MKENSTNKSGRAVKKILIVASVFVAIIALLGIVLALPTIKANKLLDGMVDCTAKDDVITGVLVTDLNSTSELVGNGGTEMLVTDKTQISALVSELHSIAGELRADTVGSSSLGAWGIRLRLYIENDEPVEIIITEEGAIIADGGRMYSYTLTDSSTQASHAKLYEKLRNMLK